MVRTSLLALLSLPLAAQAWDVRLETPFAKGQDLPFAMLRSTGQAVSGHVDTGKGVIVTVSHRIVRVGPVLKLEWNGEWSHLQADGQIQQGTASDSSRLRQDGLGLGLNAQFWVPFTGVAGELGLTERIHAYRYAGAGAAQDKNIARPWLRMGMRWNLPFPGIGPYLAASYQQPLTKDKPVGTGVAADLSSYLGAQGSGQEFQSLWTLGVGVSF
jgi:hypothetical protein